MKKYENEDREEEQDEEQQPEQKSTSVYSEDVELEKEMTGRFINKAGLLEQEITVTIKGLGTNKFGKKVLIVEYEDEERTLNISKSNFNSLLDIFGNKLKAWIGQKVRVSGEAFEGDAEKNVSAGVVLTFKKA